MSMKNTDTNIKINDQTLDFIPVKLRDNIEEIKTKITTTIPVNIEMVNDQINIIISSPRMDDDRSLTQSTAAKPITQSNCCTKKRVRILFRKT
jgi:hypothetical protein